MTGFPAVANAVAVADPDAPTHWLKPNAAGALPSAPTQISAGLTSTTGTIANGQSLSGAVAIGNTTPVALIMPATWTAAGLTLQASVDGSTYNDVYDQYGNEVALTVAASRHVLLDPSVLVGMTHVKLRSGTAGVPVNQGGARVLTIVSRGLA